MNIFLWILQVILALLLAAGGFTKAFNVDSLAELPAMATLPRIGWQAIGIFELVGAVLLIIPAAMSWKPQLTPIAAAVIAVECLALAVIYGRSSLEFAATNPLVWSLAMAVIAAIVAYGRFTLSRS